MAAAKDVDEKQWSEIRKGTRMFLLRILRWLNYAVLASSVLAIIFMLALRLVPTPWGWCFIAFSFLAISCSIIGCIHSTALSSSSSSCCYGFHTFLLITSASTQGSVFLLFVSRPGSVLSHLDSNRSDSDGRVLLKVEAALLLCTFFIDLVIMAMSCLMHHCHTSSNGKYVDLEKGIDGDSKSNGGGFFSRRSRKSSKNLSRVQEVTRIDDGESLQKGKDLPKKEEGSEISQLHEKMKEKYMTPKEAQKDVKAEEAAEEDSNGVA